MSFQYKYMKGIMLALASGIACPGEMNPVMKENMDMLRQEELYTLKQKETVMRTLEDLVYGPCDIQDVPRHKLSAENWAAVIALFVKPVNWYCITDWVCKKSLQTAEQMSHPNGQNGDADIVHPAALRANIEQAWTSGDRDQFVSQFNARVGINMAKAKKIQK